MKLPELLLSLGIAGIELAADPADASCVRHRPAVLPQNLAIGLTLHKPSVLSLMADGLRGDDDANYTYDERLGIAMDLGMRVLAGTPAWLIALGAAVCADRAMPPKCAAPGHRTPDEIAAVASSALGLRVWADVLPRGQKFRGEPDWDALRPKPKGPKNGGAP